MTLVLKGWSQERQSHLWQRLRPLKPVYFSASLFLYVGFKAV